MVVRTGRKLEKVNRCHYCAKLTRSRLRQSSRKASVTDSFYHRRSHGQARTLYRDSSTFSHMSKDKQQEHNSMFIFSSLRRRRSPWRWRPTCTDLSSVTPRPEGRLRGEASWRKTRPPTPPPGPRVGGRGRWSCGARRPRGCLPAVSVRLWSSCPPPGLPPRSKGPKAFCSRIPASRCRCRRVDLTQEDTEVRAVFRFKRKKGDCLSTGLCAKKR